MTQEVNIKLSQAKDRTGNDELEVTFQMAESQSGLTVVLTKEQAVSLSNVIRAKYGDD